MFGAIFTARSENTLRRNAVVMPLYTITLAFIFFAGFAAVLVVPRLADGDLSLLTVVQKSFPPWFLGVIGGSGALTAMVPASILLLSAATLFAKNFCRPMLAPSLSDYQVGRLARIMVIVLSVVAVYFAIHSSATIVALLLVGYAGVTQFFPGVVLGLYWKRASTIAVFAGIVTGVAIVAGLMLTKHDPIFGLNDGFLALCANFLVTVLLSLASRPRLDGFVEDRAQDAAVSQSLH